VNRLSTRRVYLDHIRPPDISLIYDLLVDPDTGPVFRFSGGTPSPQYLQQHLWDDILAQWMVAGLRDHKRRGLVSIASPDFRNGFAYLSALATPECRHTGLVMEAVGLAVDYAFRTWPFRKLYAEVSETRLELFAGCIGRFCVEEGRLKAHHYHDGRFRDMITLATYREHWQELRQRFGKLETSTNVPLVDDGGPEEFAPSPHALQRGGRT